MYRFVCVYLFVIFCWQNKVIQTHIQKLHWVKNKKLSLLNSKALTIHLTLNSVALIARTVTFLGGKAGGAWMVWNSFEDSEGCECPTTLLAIRRNRYWVKGTNPVTVMDLASGSDTSYITNQDTFLVVWASTVHLVMEEFPSNPGVNWRTTEKASMLERASFVGGSGRTGSTPDCMVAILGGPIPTAVEAVT